ncbi:MULTISPECIES: hypothetical protein [Streptomyces]|uniref:Uncharacterized protein n=2 Tax=Streptomyces TaxID=1883 RepID=A0A2N8PCB3_STRNR|nr:MULTISPECIES: hypothetical protein [Streptomyces]PNE38668.1 hypothetical protein AOB60_32385 [Streptomyces noursei]SHN01162.1 hypothetical protein SAMN05216268_117176 [Streptomyces yunnanensis]
MADQYRVDLSALEETMRKLNGILKDLGSAHSDARYKTSLSQNALGADAGGANFMEARRLTEAHTDMKNSIESIVGHLHDVTNEFGTKTKKVHGNYQNQEADTAANMS